MQINYISKLSAYLDIILPVAEDSWACNGLEVYTLQKLFTSL